FLLTLSNNGATFCHGQLLGVILTLILHPKGKMLNHFNGGDGQEKGFCVLTPSPLSSCKK
ncbi:MAG: hypothetical protein II670_01350, partial [Alphaproteobacteria bacterium]|nr:hypothetical protein [Alphaproteobacteria bacterium]